MSSRHGVYVSQCGRPGAWLLAACLAMALAGCGGKGAAGASAAPVRVAAVEQGSVAAEISAIGSILPIESVAVKSRVDGQIVAVGARPGADVQKGQLLFRIDPRPFEVELEAANAALARDEALQAKAEDLLKRSEDLVTKGFMSANQFEIAKSDARAAAAVVNGGRAAVASARLNLGFAELRSPITGRIGRVPLQNGNLVKANDTTALMTVIQMDPIYADFTVPERFVADLKSAAAHGRVEVAVTADGVGGVALERRGPLTFVDNQVDQASGTIRVRATLANADRALWPGQYVGIRIALPIADQVLFVPASAVGQSPAGPYVYVVDAALKAEQRHVSVVRTEGERSVVAGSIKVGERVVVDGQSRVLPGGAVTIVTDAPAAATGTSAQAAAVPAGH